MALNVYIRLNYFVFSLYTHVFPCSFTGFLLSFHCSRAQILNFPTVFANLEYLVKKGCKRCSTILYLPFTAILNYPKMEKECTPEVM